MKPSLPRIVPARQAHAAFLALALGLPTLASPASAGTGLAPAGRWITASGNLEVEIAPCGTALCGTVSRVLANRSMERADQAMEPADGRPALGMTLLRDLRIVRAADDESAPVSWDGEIYNRENGKTYRCRVSLSTEQDPEGELLVRPYIGLPLFGRTQRWQRAPSPSQPAPQP